MSHWPLSKPFSPQRLKTYIICFILKRNNRCVPATGYAKIDLCIYGKSASLMTKVMRVFLFAELIRPLIFIASLPYFTASDAWCPSGAVSWPWGCSRITWWCHVFTKGRCLSRSRKKHRQWNTWMSQEVSNWVVNSKCISGLLKWSKWVNG